MEWSDWSDDAFARARERGLPVFLFVKAGWCRWCRELEQNVLADDRVADVLERDFVCVKVDKDRRPDIDARYTKGGWPTLAYLDAGGEVLAVDNYMEVEALRRRLELIGEYAARGRGQAGRAGIVLEPEPKPRPTPPPRPSPASLGRREVALSLDVVEEVARTLLESADPVHGGWGTRHKFPHPEAIDFSLIRWSQTGDQDMLDLVRRTLRHMQAGEIHDRIEGGFYRYATRPDWSEPHHEKMLDSNAQRMYAYLEAYQALGEESFELTARGVLGWMMATLLDEETGAFRGSQDADPTYAHLGSLAQRRAMGAPPCDPTIFANWNAIAVTALLKAAIVLDEPRWREQALRTLDFLVERLFDESQGMFHYWDGAPHLPGMLSDQAYTLQALIMAMQHAGENRYLKPAEKLAKLSVEHLRAEDGGFYDMRFDPYARGGLRHRNRSILENSVMAEALLRLAHFSGDSDYEDSAREALTSFVLDFKRYGHYVAGFARAVDLLFHAPLLVTVVGRRSNPATAALARAALAPYVASRIVQTIDPVEERELMERFGMPTPPEEVRAYVHRGRESYAETSDPARLPALMTRTERGR